MKPALVTKALTTRGTRFWFIHWAPTARVDIEIPIDGQYPGMVKFVRFTKVTQDEISFFLNNF